MLQLRDYQQKCIDAIEAAEREGCREQLIVKPTAAGKTVTFAHLIARRGGRAIILVHRDELIQQSKDKLRRVMPQAQIGIVRGEANQHNCQIVIASMQTLARERRLKKLKPDFDTIICDEAHISRAESLDRTLAYLKQSNPLLTGWTATPYRLDGKPLCRDERRAKGNEPFARRVFELSIADGVEGGWLCEPTGKLVHIRGLDLSGIATTRGDLDAEQLEIAMKAANWQEWVGRAMLEHAAGRQSIVFVPPRVQMAQELATHLTAIGIPAVAVTGKTDVVARRRIYERFRARELAAMVSVDVLTTGFDESSVDCIVMARATKSKTLYVQAVGRGLRLHPGKRDCLVLDLTGMSVRHDLASLTMIYGTKRVEDGESMTQARERERRERITTEEEKIRLEAEQEARRINLLKWRESLFQPDPVPPASRWLWRVGINGEALRLPDHTDLELRRMAGGAWIAQDNEGRFRAIRATAAEARSAAETFASTIRRPRETWEIPTEKQISFARRLHLSFDVATITRRELSRLIDRKKNQLAERKGRAA